MMNGITVIEKEEQFSPAITRFNYREALEVAAEGGLSTEIALAMGCPVRRYNELLHKDAAYAGAMKRARAQGYELRAEKMLTIRQDNPTVDIKELELEFKINQWFLSKMHAAVFGDKLALTVEHVDVLGAMSDARSRVAKVINSVPEPEIEDAETEDVDPFS